MKKKLTTLILLVYCTSMLFAQIDNKEFIDNYKTAIDNVFSEIQQKKITTGVLMERSVANLNVGDFNGDKTSVICDANAWLQLYKQIYLGHLNFEDFNFDESLFKTNNSDGDIEIGIIFYDYNRFSPDAVTNGNIVFDEVNNKIIDATSSNETPFIIETCFAVAPMELEINTGTYSFYVNPDIFITNKEVGIEQLYINFDDGMGYVETNIGSTELVNYYDAGSKNIKVKAVIGGQKYYSQSKITVSSEVDNIVTLKSTDGNIVTLKSTDGNIVALKSTESNVNPDFGPQNYQSAGILAKYGVYYRCKNDGKIRKPYMIVSGIDPPDVNRIGEPLAEDTDKGEKVNLYRVANKDGYLDGLREDGYDIIIYRSTQSTKSIITNAMNLVSFIQKINSEKTSDNELIITGASMGGLIVRYALTYMEKYNIDHQTKLFISLDSPQNGANTTLGMQYMIKYLNEDLDLIIDVDLLEDLKLAKDGIDSEAAREMLIYHYAGTSGGKADSDARRKSYLSSLASIGNFPKNCRNIAISLGSGVGTGQGFNSGQELLSKEPSMLFGGVLNPGVQVRLEFSAYAVPDNYASIVYSEEIYAEVCAPVPTCCPIGTRMACVNLPELSFLRSEWVNNTKSMDNAPGSVNDLHNLGILKSSVPNILKNLGVIDYNVNSDCFIPAFSALALNSVTNPHTNIKSYFSASPYVQEIATNLYLNTGGDPISNFDLLYIEDINNGHIYDIETKEGVFSPTLLAQMYGMVSPEDMYVEDKTISSGQSVAYEALKTINVGANVDENLLPNGNVIVESGGSLSLSAAESIVLADGFKANIGSSVLVSNSVGDYCPEGSVTTKSANSTTHEVVNVPVVREDLDQKEEIYLAQIIEDYSKPIIVFPNPVKDVLYISSNKVSNNFFMYNLEGSLILKKSFSRTLEVDMHDYSSGVYLIKVVQLNGEEFQEQIVKQ